MNWFTDWLFGDTGSSTTSTTTATEDETIHVNPATGLPMIGGIGGVDSMGNPYGMDLSSHHGMHQDDGGLGMGSSIGSDPFDSFDNR